MHLLQRAKILILLTGIFALLFSDLISQPITFLKTYNTGNSGYAVREVDGNSFVVAGSTDFYYNWHFINMSPIANTNVQLIKTDLNGNLTWEKIYNLPGSRTLATWMEPTTDDGYIITGRSNHDVVWPPDSNDILLIKTDVDGNIQWSKVFDTGKDEVGFCVRPTFDGGYIVSGFHDAVPVSDVGNTYALMIKTDGNGNMLWNKKYQFAVRDLMTDEPLTWVVNQTADSGFVLAGTTAGSHAADVYVIRTDKVGNVVWAKSYEHDASILRFSLALDVMEDLAGNIIIAGSMDKDQTLSEYNYPYILKLSSAGAIVDDRFYDSAPAQMFQAGFSSVEQTPDGGFFFTGMGGYGGFGMQAQLLKTDVNFNMQWSRAYANDGAATIGSRSGRLSSDGGYVFTGRKFMAGTVLWKTDQFGFTPCKTPGALLELFPSIFAQDRFPLAFSGINGNDVVFNTQLQLIDTTTICPLEFTDLPVELLSFSAREVPGNQVQLKWETASEINSDFFVLGKSIDGIVFSDFGKIRAAGNTSTKKSYSILDTGVPGVSTVYYRLEQFDFDGARAISKTIPVQISGNGLLLNGVEIDHRSGTIIISFQGSFREVINCTLCNMTGQACAHQSQMSDSPYLEIRLDAGQLPGGIYFLRINDGTELITRKIFY